MQSNMRSNMRVKFLATFLMLLVARNGFAYHWFNDAGTGPAAGTFVFQHWAALPVHYIVDNEPLPGGLTIAGNITPAFSTWQNVPTSSIAFQMDTNTTGIANFTYATCACNPDVVSPTWGITTDGRNEVGFLHNADLGAGSFGKGIGTVNTDTGEITDFVLLINIDSSAGTDPTLTGVMVHEVGHVIGLGHSTVGSPDFTFFPLPQAERPTMFPYAQASDNNRLESLEPDDLLIISRIYPDPSFAAGQKISGRVLKGTDGTWTRGVEVRLVSVSDNNDQVGVLSDVLGQSNGAWDVPGLATGDWYVTIDPVAGMIGPDWIEDDNDIGGLATTYGGFPREHYDAAESNHDTASARVTIPVFAGFDSHNVVLVTNEGSRPDLAITPWGFDQAPPAPPWWQTPDIWVDTNMNGIHNESDEPERGRADNKLTAHITNRGNAPLTGYRVHFRFLPYTTNASMPPQEIGVVDETAALAAGATRDSTIDWNLGSSVLSALPPPFDTADHFCVQAGIEDPSGGALTNDANPANNFAQNNFVNVPMCTTCFQRARFVVYNHLAHAARASLRSSVRAGRGELRFEEIADASNIALAPGEYRFVTAHVVSETEQPVLFDVTQQLDGETVGGLTIALAPQTHGDGTGGPGSFGPWLLGVATGGNWPLGGMNRDFDPSFLFTLQLERVIAPRLRIGLQGGYHQFDEQVATNLGITNLSLIAKITGAPGTAARPFVIFGPGAYRVAGTWHGGAQLGIGYEVPVTPSAALMTGATVHRLAGTLPVERPARGEWIDGYLGFIFRFP
jgi:hypothetical protein